MSGARVVPELIDAVRDYLAAWPAERVARLQTVDAGWAPFDENQRPTAFYGPADLREICQTVHGQCSALRSAGMSLAPELLELDLFLSLACARLSRFEAPTCS